MHLHLTTILHAHFHLCMIAYAFPFLALAVPLPAPSASSPAGSGIIITQDQLLAIAPKSSTCCGAPFPSECATASKAADPISSSLAKYNIESKAEQAAIISWMAFESGDFKYNQNHFPAPGRPGQGTRNMQMPTYNTAYAQSLGLMTTTTSPQPKNPDAPTLAVLESNDEYSFGSGAWYLSTYCSPDVRRSLQAGSLAGWEAFVTTCVGTDVTVERRQYWERAVKALGV